MVGGSSPQAPPEAPAGGGNFFAILTSTHDFDHSADARTLSTLERTPRHRGRGERHTADAETHSHTLEHTLRFQCPLRVATTSLRYESPPPRRPHPPRRRHPAPALPPVAHRRAARCACPRAVREVRLPHTKEREGMQTTPSAVADLWSPAVEMCVRTRGAWGSTLQSNQVATP